VFFKSCLWKGGEGSVKLVFKQIFL
jgi:hypothetical protein